MLTALIVGSAGSTYTGCDQHGHCFPSIGRVAEIVGRGEKSVRESFDQLEDLQLISFPMGRSRGRTPSLIRIDAAIDPVENDSVLNGVSSERVASPTLPIRNDQPSQERGGNQSKQNHRKAAAACTYGGTPAFSDAVHGLGLTGRARSEALEAWHENAGRVAGLATKARAKAKSSPGGLFLKMIRDGEQTDPPPVAKDPIAWLATHAARSQTHESRLEVLQANFRLSPEEATGLLKREEMHHAA